MIPGDVRLLVVSVLLLAFGLGLRAGLIRRVAWIYFDLGWPRTMRNGLFTLLPFGVIALGAYPLSVVGPPVSPSHDNTVAEDILVLIVLPTLALDIVTFFRPPTFLKPQWIREADRELRDDPSGRKRAELLRRLRRRS